MSIIRYILKFINLNGQKTHIPVLYIGTFTPNFEIDKVAIAKSAVLTVGNHFIKGISMGYYAVEGAIKNKEGDAVSSAVNNVYENSIFSYVEKGDQLNIKPSTCFGLKFDECENAKKEEAE